MSDQELRCGKKNTGHSLAPSWVSVVAALASIVSGAVLTLGDAWVLISLRLHPWTS